ncbi:hypothetical protein Patl1_25991 [Pistacia atlantica]|uniref:Uncharacterized protein n=1 Tax=Pistacia atlantica TaxID=434234 RepID=A0ACC1B4Z8_9ROSI|nr:hypothetical protein Patl1_25991 [Pistacia atlantica]
MEDQFPKMENFMHKELPSYFHGMVPSGSKFFGDSIFWGALNDTGCGDHTGCGNNMKSSSSSPDRLFSSSESSSSAEEVSGASLLSNIPGFIKQDVIREQFVSGLCCVHPHGGASVSDVKDSFIPVNFLESFPELTQAQVSEPPSPSSLSTTSKFPNLTLFLQEPPILNPSTQMANSLGKNQENHEIMSLSPNPSFHLPQPGHLQCQPGNEWLKIDRTKLQAISQDISSNKKANEHQQPSTSPKKNPSAQNAKVLKNLLQNTQTTTTNWQFELESKVGSEVTENTKKIQEVSLEMDTVQLSRMPSLDMDMIWDALLVSD